MYVYTQQPVFCVRKTKLINLDSVYAGEVIFQIGKGVPRHLSVSLFLNLFFLK